MTKSSSDTPLNRTPTPSQLELHYNSHRVMPSVLYKSISGNIPPPHYHSRGVVHPTRPWRFPNSSTTRPVGLPYSISQQSLNSRAGCQCQCESIRIQVSRLVSLFRESSIVLFCLEKGEFLPSLFRNRWDTATFFRDFVSYFVSLSRIKASSYDFFLFRNRVSRCTYVSVRKHRDELIFILVSEMDSFISLFQKGEFLHFFVSWTDELLCFFASEKGESLYVRVCLKTKRWVDFHLGFWNGQLHFFVPKRRVTTLLAFVNRWITLHLCFGHKWVSV
jgi:hypothetical protein